VCLPIVAIVSAPADIDGVAATVNAVRFFPDAVFAPAPAVEIFWRGGRQIGVNKSLGGR